jgi:hypothetical protein
LLRTHENLLGLGEFQQFGPTAGGVEAQWSWKMLLLNNSWALFPELRFKCADVLSVNPPRARPPTQQNFVHTALPKSEI